MAIGVIPTDPPVPRKIGRNRGWLLQCGEGSAANPASVE
jgi:hypothetical protein